MGEEFRKWVGTIGIPAAICFYLLARVETAVNDMRTAVVELRITISAGCTPPLPGALGTRPLR